MSDSYLRRISEYSSLLYKVVAGKQNDQSWLPQIYSRAIMSHSLQEQEREEFFKWLLPELRTLWTASRLVSEFVSSNNCFLFSYTKQ